MHTVIRYMYVVAHLCLHPISVSLTRNRDTKRDDFVFFTNRLACLAMEYALSLLPFQVRSYDSHLIM